MDDPNAPPAQAPTRMLVGALAHLAQHMESDCPRAAHLAVMLLEQIAADAKTDTHLRQHALQLVEILERDPPHAPSGDASPASHRLAGTRHFPAQKGG